MTRHYATACDPGYLPRLRALVASMRRHCAPFRLHVLAHGADVVRWAAAQPDVACTDVASFLFRHPEYAPSALPGPMRTRMDEILCTYRWRFFADLLFDHGQPVTAIDADLMFFGDPGPVFEEIGTAPAAVLRHAFPRADAGLPGVCWETHRKFGLFNGGFVHLAARTPAEFMAETTRQWCYPGFREWPDGRRTYGDQGTLEVLADEFPATHVIANPATAPGPWCIHNHPLTTRDGRLYFGDRHLISYHFQSYRPGGQLADPHYEVERAPGAVELIYGHYREALETG